VAFPEPTPGLVIRYSYLWLREHLEGREEGHKDRPCAIVAAIRRGADETRVLVLPVTHTPPADASAAIEIALEAKQRLGLDDERSWVVLTEWNEFVWPGPDLRPVPGDTEGAVTYGMMPRALFEQIRGGLLAFARAKAARAVPRT
jgi:hypothetical protein